MGFVVHKVSLGQVFSEDFGFPSQLAYHGLFHDNHHHLSSGAGKKAKQWPQYQVDTVSPREKK
jgi:hypothetical protein